MKKTLFTLGISFDTVTPESAENGDIADNGWMQEPEPASLRECLEAVRRMGGIDFHDCVTFYPCDSSVDYVTGESTREYIHVEPLTPSAGRAWQRALKLYGI